MNPQSPTATLPETSPVQLDSCRHSDVSLVVIAVVANCETTALQCDYCGKLLTDPKTDC